MIALWMKRENKRWDPKPGLLPLALPGKSSEEAQGLHGVVWILQDTEPGHSAVVMVQYLCLSVFLPLLFLLLISTASPSLSPVSLSPFLSPPPYCFSEREQMCEGQYPSSS